MEPLTFDPAGECIYCGAQEELSREHVIPFALGGRVVLPDSSCARCAAETSAFEGRLLRSPNWWPLRRALDLATRHAKRQPDSFALSVKAAGQTFSVDVKVSSYPLIVAVFDFDPPVHLTGAPVPAGGETHAIAQRVFAWNVRALQFGGGFETLLNGRLVAPRTDVTLRVDMSADDLARLLAKIALAWAAGRYGVRAFEAIYVRDIIVGAGLEPNRWIGSASVHPQFDGRALHVIRDAIVGRDLVVYIQLFRPPPGWEQPSVYQVVVGRLSPVGSAM